MRIVYFSLSFGVVNSLDSELLEKSNNCGDLMVTKWFSKQSCNNIYCLEMSSIWRLKLRSDGSKKSIAQHIVWNGIDRQIVIDVAVGDIPKGVSLRVCRFRSWWDFWNLCKFLRHFDWLICWLLFTSDELLKQMNQLGFRDWRSSRSGRLRDLLEGGKFVVL